MKKNILTKEQINKKTKGQYFTINNPFEHKAFKKWYETYVGFDEIILEPFAGSNHIPYLCKKINIINNWHCFDIEPQDVNLTPEFDITFQDTIKDFPNGYNTVITNPPYLAKVSASRLKLEYPDTHYEDLYMLCLDKMLTNCENVAVIIPESFITSGYFIDRLYCVISLNFPMFDDTDCPVCLALFTKNGAENNCFEIYVGDTLISTYCDLKTFSLKEYENYYKKWKFNDPQGNIGVKCVDNQSKDDIYFHHGDKIEPSKIKISSRAFSRISGLPIDINIDEFILTCNNIINEYRNNTKDVFMTSFKGLRKDGVYRRRIDFKTLRCIMNYALKKLSK